MKKKKIVAISLIVLITIISIVLISLYVLIRINLTMKAIVIKCDKNSMLVYEEDKETLTLVGIPKDINLEFKPGQEVRIYLVNNTLITYSYPRSIYSSFIKRIKIIKDEENTQIVEKILEQEFLREENIRN